MTSVLASRARPAIQQGGVRALRRRDLPAIVRLHRRVFGSAPSQAPNVERYLHEILWSNPWGAESCPSLVYEDSRGVPLGCLCVMPRRMLFRGRPIVMAVGHHFMVDPDRRHSLAAVALLQAFRSGPQQVLLAEANDVSRKLWEGVHGGVSYLQSLRWVRPLRPAHYLVSALRRQGFSRVASLVSPLAGAVDLVAREPAIDATVSLSASTLDEETLLDCIRQVSGGYELRPDYDAPSITWLVGLLSCRKDSGTLQRVLLRTPNGELAGWYLYFSKPGGTSEVVQISGRRRWLGDVFDHLLMHARQGGAAAVSGRLDPALVAVCATRQCFYRGGGSWMLIDSPNRDILVAIQCGDAFLTRLEGEWWIGF